MNFLLPTPWRIASPGLSSNHGCKRNKVSGLDGFSLPHGQALSIGSSWLAGSKDILSMAMRQTCNIVSKEAGWEIYFLPNATTIHYGGRSMNCWSCRKMVYRVSYCSTKNTMAFYKRLPCDLCLAFSAL